MSVVTIRVKAEEFNQVTSRLSVRPTDMMRSQKMTIPSTDIMSVGPCDSDVDVGEKVIVGDRVGRLIAIEGRWAVVSAGDGAMPIVTSIHRVVSFSKMEA